MPTGLIWVWVCLPNQATIISVLPPDFVPQCLVALYRQSRRIF